MPSVQGSSECSGYEPARLERPMWQLQAVIMPWMHCAIRQQISCSIAGSRLPQMPCGLGSCCMSMRISPPTISTCFPHRRYMVAFAVVLTLHGDTHVSRHDQPCHLGWASWRQYVLFALHEGCLPWTDRSGARFLGRCSGSKQVRSVPSSSDGGWTIPLYPPPPPLFGPKEE